jgi:hypothetical protein
VEETAVKCEPTSIWYSSVSIKLDRFLHSICCNARVFVHRAINPVYFRGPAKNLYVTH